MRVCNANKVWRPRWPERESMGPLIHRGREGEGVETYRYGWYWWWSTAITQPLLRGKIVWIQGRFTVGDGTLVVVR